MTPVGRDHVGDDDQDDADGNSSAADEPTAIWDIDALRAAGLSELLDRPNEEEAPRRPTTSPPQNAEPSMVISTEVLTEPPPAEGSEASREVTPSQGFAIPSDSVAPPVMRSRMESIPARRYGWGGAVAAGALFFGLVYALIRYLM